MEKNIFSLLIILFLHSIALAQEQNLPKEIQTISACVLNSIAGTEEDCMGDLLSTRISKNEIIGNWLFMGEQGNKLNATNPYQIVPHTPDGDTSKPFPEGCFVLMSVKPTYAVQSKTCAPTLEQDVPSIESIAKFTYRLMDPGMIELSQKVKNNYTTAKCSLIWFSGANYMICKAIEQQEQIQSVATFKKD